MENSKEEILQRLYREVKKGGRGFQVDSVRPHLDIICDYASRCRTVTEFGFGSGCVTAALVVSGCKNIHAYDIQLSATAHLVRETARECGIRLRMYCKDVLKTKISRTDLLFIDTDHWYYQLKSELERHHKRVRRWIIIHSTETFGLMNPFDGRPGIKAAMYGFMDEHPEWELREHISTGHGMTVLERSGKSRKTKRKNDETDG